MNKYAAEKIAQEYYNLGLRLALEKVAKIELSEIAEAMDRQQALHGGSVEDRIGTALEQRRREGALAGTLSGALTGAGMSAHRFGGGDPKKAIIAALLGGGAGAVGGNLLGRAVGLGMGGIEGGLSALPGIRQGADVLTRPLNEYIG